MRTLVTAVACLLALADPASAQWHRIGPDGGGLNRLAQSPSNPSRLWAGAGMSVVRSDDRGDTWSERGAFGDEILHIAVDAGAEDTAYVVTEGPPASNGFRTWLLHRTTDGGTTWSSTEAIPGEAISALAAHPTVSGSVFIGGGDRVLRSTDAGATWAGAVVSPNLGVSHIAPSASAPAVVWASMGRVAGTLNSGGIFKSSDGGQTWDYKTFHDQITAIAVDPTDADVVYAADGYTSFFTLLRTFDGGQTWQSGGAGLPALPPTSIAVDPVTPSRVYVTTTSGVFVSVDAGATFAPASTGLDANAAPHDLAVDRTQPSRLVAASNRGVARSDDAAASWTHHAAGVPETAVTDIAAVDPSTILLASGSRGVLRTVDGAMSWQTANTGLSTLSLRGVTVGPASSQLAFAIYGGQAASFARSTNVGTTWTDEPIDHDVVYDMAVAPSDPLRVYAVHSDGGATPGPLLKSVDGGVTWVGLPVAGLSTFLTARVLVHPSNPDALWILSRQSVARSSNGGASWTVVNVPGLGGASSVQSGAVDPRQPSRIVVGVHDNAPSASGGGVFLSQNSGATWSRIHDRNVRVVAIHPVDGRIFAASDMGVIASAANGASWIDITGDLPRQWPFDLVATEDSVYVTLYAGGVYRLDPVACAPEPADDCARSTAGAAQLQWKRPTPARATLKASLGRLGAIMPGDVGSPELDDGTDYGVCVYDHSGPGGAARLVTTLTAPATDGCGAPPCWRRSGAKLIYRDRAGLPDGLSDLSVRQGADARTQWKAKAKGALLDVPAGVVPPVVLQVRRTDHPACWDATFSTNIQRNDATTFKARGD